MKKIVATCVICSLVFVLGLSSIAYAKGGGVNPVEALLGMFGKIENAAQIETGGDLVTAQSEDNIVIPFNEEGDQVQHVSLTIAGHHLGVDTQVQINLDYEYAGTSFGPSIIIYNDGVLHPDVKTIEFNAKHWELGIYHPVMDEQGPDTSIAYEYTITYPPTD